jgi:hypothetical protein
MLLQFCDKCGRPLSEGCIARGEAMELKGELICAHCKSSIPAAEPEATPLGQYQQAVWSCETCGIPVTALDLIEGRASRIGGLLKCSRCSPAGAVASPAVLAQPPRGQALPLPKPARARSAPPVVSRKLASAPKPTAASADNYVAEAQTERRRPILPILMFAIVMPMFAISLFYAITSQVKLNEVMGKQNATEDEPDRRQRRPQEKLEPDQPEPDKPKVEPVKPEPPPEQAPARRVLPDEVVNELVGVERDLARPVIAKLQSTDLAVVWEGLIEAGRLRLIATRPYVRALLADKDDQTRAAACRVSGMLSDREALLKLARMADQDPAEPVRIEARKARDRLSGEATRDMRDLSESELNEMLRDIQRELERRKGRSD